MRHTSEGLQGTVAVVTGGGTGIGRALVLQLATQGVQVVVCGRREAPLNETCEAVRRTGGHCLAVPVDVRDSVQVHDMVAAVIDCHGRIDFLVNNAGTALAKPLLDTTDREWDALLDTNLRGPFLCAREVLPHQAAAGHGAIVNVSSILGRFGIPRFGAYCASKFGLLGLTEVLAQEAAPLGVRVYAVCPGSTDTDLHRGVAGTDGIAGAMSPERVAGEIVRLLLGETDVPLGGALIVDGGVTRVHVPLDNRPKGWRNRLARCLAIGRSVLSRVRNGKR